MNTWFLNSELSTCLQLELCLYEQTQIVANAAYRVGRKKFSMYRFSQSMHQTMQTDLTFTKVLFANV